MIKVKAMRIKDHYEMREYTIDMLEEEEESCTHGEARPYPLYPSKGGLKPSFLRDIISRYAACKLHGVFLNIHLYLFVPPI